MQNNKIAHCQNRNIFKGFVQPVDILFLMSISRGYPYKKTNKRKNTEELIVLRDLQKDIEKNGLIDPFFISVSKSTLEYRLESGNNRIFLLKEMGFTHVDSVVLISDNVIRYKENGEHKFSGIEINLEKTNYSNFPYDSVCFGRPSDIFNLRGVFLNG